MSTILRSVHRLGSYITLNIFVQYVKREDVILMAGAGNSRLTEDMFEDG